MWYNSSQFGLRAFPGAWGRAAGSRALELRRLRDQDLDSLRRRAHAYVREVDRPVPSRELARVLFDSDPPEEQLSPLLIRTLLKRDRRFLETRRGTWDLIGARYHGVPLESARFVVVDLEATGSNPREDRVIEVGVVVVEGLRVCERFHTLVHPQRRIPPWIVGLTGIDESTVERAPRFHQIVPRLLGLLSDGIFVAHNVDFDYRFLRQRLRVAGYAPEPWPTLCTVRLARRILPDLDSYRLDSLAESLDLGLEHHHRAIDDAEATARLLLHILDKVRSEGRAASVGELLGLVRSARTTPAS